MFAMDMDSAADARSNLSVSSKDSAHPGLVDSRAFLTLVPCIVLCPIFSPASARSMDNLSIYLVALDTSLVQGDADGRLWLAPVARLDGDKLRALDAAANDCVSSAAPLRDDCG